MKTTTNHTILLSEPETRTAIAAYLGSRDIPLPPDYSAITIKWTAKGEARVSFALETEGASA